MTNNTIKIKNKILEIPAALAAIPVNPKSAAIKATTKKMSDQRSIIIVFNGYCIEHKNLMPA